MMGVCSDQLSSAAVFESSDYFSSFYLYLAFSQGLTGPLGLKGDEGPRGPPGDPAKGVRITSRIFGKTVTRGCHNTTSVSLKQIIGPTGKKGARVSSLRLNAPPNKGVLISRVHRSAGK